MNNRHYRGRRRLRITGRFYAFLTVVLVLVVMVGVLIANRSASQGAPPVPQAYEPTLVTTQQTPEPVVTSQQTEAPTQPIVAAPPALADQPVVTAPATGQAGQGSVDTDYSDIEASLDAAPMTGDETADVSNLSVTQGLSPDWRNILLLGTDTRNLNKIARTDTIMIASVNTKDGRIKLTSIMRDMVVPITNKKGEYKEVKINSVISYGGVDAVMKTVNELFGMNITEYVMVNFASFQKVIDVLGGIRIDVSQAERDEINKSLGEQAKVAGMDQAEYLAKRDSMELKTYGGDQLLTGTQALGYARIRHVGGGDYQRTDRQRTVLDAILKKAKEADLGQIFQIATQMWGEFQTNIDIFSAVNIATTVIKNGGKMETRGRIPGSSAYFVSEKRGGTSALWDTDFEANKQLLYAYVYDS